MAKSTILTRIIKNTEIHINIFNIHIHMISKSLSFFDNIIILIIEY